MKVLRLHKPLDLRLHDEPVPEPGPNEALVEVKSVGVCASDVHYYREGGIGDQIVREPLVLGHEFSGVVVEVGGEVKELLPGTRVVLEPGKPCGRCGQCKRGLINLCRNIEFFGTPPIDGAFREYLTWPAELMIPMPDEMSFDEAAMIEPMAVGVYSAELAGIKGGEKVAVLGAGAIGLSCLQAARAAGAVFAVVSEPVAERREVAVKLGADMVVDPTTTDVAQAIMDSTGGEGADVVFEAAGEMETCEQTGFAAKPAGTIVIVGIPSEDIYGFNATNARRRELTVKFARRSRNAAVRSVELWERGLIDLARYATHAFSMEDVKQALDLAHEKRDGVVRAVIRVSE